MFLGNPPEILSNFYQHAPFAFKGWEYVLVEQGVIEQKRFL